MKKLVKSSSGSYTGEPVSGLEYGNYMTNYYATLKTKYKPFEVRPLYQDRSSTRVSGYTAEKVDGHGYTYYHIDIRNYDNVHVVYGPFELEYNRSDKELKSMFESIYGDVKNYKVGEYDSLDEAMEAII